jgi:hypothetical protein
VPDPGMHEVDGVRGVRDGAEAEKDRRGSGLLPLSLAAELDIVRPPRQVFRMSSPPNAQIQAGVTAFVTQMLAVTLDLTYYRLLGYPAGRASGFILERQARHFVVTAGHTFRRRKRWMIDTGIQVQNTTLAFPANGVWQVQAGNIRAPWSWRTIDFAWFELDVPALSLKLRADPRLAGISVSLNWYSGPIGVPSAGTAYGFAARSQVEYHVFSRILRRDAIWEAGMTYQGIDPTNGLYRFLLPGKHKGHRHYKGASGAPIADASGQIVSLVLRGDPGANTIFGLPLKPLEPFLTIGHTGAYPSNVSPPT